MIVFENNCAEEANVSGKCKNTRRTMVKTFKPISWMITIFGIYFSNVGHTVPSPAGRRVRILYCMICNGIVWSPAVRCAVCLTKFSSVDGHFLLQASFFIQMASVSILVSIFTLTSSSAWPAFVNSLQKLHDSYGSPAYTRNGERKLRILILTSMCCMLMLAITFNFILVSSEEVQSGHHCIMFPSQINQTAMHYSLIGFHVFAASFAGLGFAAIELLVFVTCYVLTKEFARANKNIRGILCSKENSDMSTIVENARHQYEDVVALLQHGNRLLSMFALIQYATTIPYVCFTAYSLAREKYSAETMLMSLSGSTGLLSIAGIITYCGIIINSQAHGLVDDILRVDFARLSGATARSLSVFLNRLTGTNIGLSAGGLFIVDKASFLTVSGALITYLIVVFQFQPTSSNLPLQNCINGTIFEDK